MIFKRKQIIEIYLFAFGEPMPKDLGHIEAGMLCLKELGVESFKFALMSTSK